MKPEFRETARWRESRGEHFGTPCSEEMVEGYWVCGRCAESYEDEYDADECCRHKHACPECERKWPDLDHEYRCDDIACDSDERAKPCENHKA
jgi:hypothetical protein